MPRTPRGHAAAPTVHAPSVVRKSRRVFIMICYDASWTVAVSYPIDSRQQVNPAGLWLDHRLFACAACYRFRLAAGRFALPDPRLEGEAHVPFPPPKHGLAPRGSRRVGAARRRAPTVRRSARARLRVGDGRRSTRRRRARCHRDRHQPADRASSAPSSPTRRASTTSPQLNPGQYDVSAELDGFKKATAPACSSTRRPASRSTSRSRPARSPRVVTVTAEAPPLQTDVDAPQDGRGEGHRAAVVHRPQPDRRGRPQGRRRSAAASTTTASRASATAASTSTAAAPTRTTSRSTAPRPSARGRPARSSASRTSTRSRKCRS